MLCSVIEHGMTSLSFQTAIQKNEGSEVTEHGVTSFCFQTVQKTSASLGPFVWQFKT